MAREISMEANGKMADNRKVTDNYLNNPYGLVGDESVSDLSPMIGRDRPSHGEVTIQISYQPDVEKAWVAARVAIGRQNGKKNSLDTRSDIVKGRGRLDIISKLKGLLIDRLVTGLLRRFR